MKSTQYSTRRMTARDTSQWLDAGPPVVFIHGLIGHLRASAEALGSHGRATLAPDLLGYGVRADVADEEITLPAQADELRSCIRRAYGNTPVDIVGHSVGGVIALLYASQEAGAVRRFVNVEGNFTLKDAFWSASLGRMSHVEVQEVLAGFRADPVAWLAKSGVTPSEKNLALAKEWLGFQPPTTLRAMGRSIVQITDVPQYLELTRKVFASAPVYLLSGERSRPTWDVPPWALQEAKAEIVMPNVGHMMMMEQPELFVRRLSELLS